MWPTQRAFSSGFALYLCGQLQLQLLQFASSPVGHLAWPRPIGQCQAAACHPAILNASQLVNLRSAHLECLLAHSNCRRQYLIEFSSKDVPKLKSLPKTKTILALIWNFKNIKSNIIIFIACLININYDLSKYTLVVVALREIPHIHRYEIWKKFFDCTLQNGLLQWLGHFWLCFLVLLLQLVCFIMPHLLHLRPFSQKKKKERIERSEPN